MQSEINRLRWQVRGMAAAMLGMAGVWLMGGAKDDDARVRNLVCEKFAVVDSDGNPRIVMLTKGNSAAISIAGGKDPDKIQWMIAANSEGVGQRFQNENRTGRLKIALEGDTPTIEIMEREAPEKEPVPRLIMGQTVNGQYGMYWADFDGKVTKTLTTAE